MADGTDDDALGTLAAQRRFRAGDVAGAEAILSALLAAEFGAGHVDVAIRSDGYSLNSLNGRAELDGDAFFFKCHIEEAAEETMAEWYRAELLAEAGYPIELPARAISSPGRQILLYRWNEHERLADACLRAELTGDRDLMATLVAEQRELDRVVGERMTASLHRVDAAELVAEPIHQLFGLRAVAGSRADRFYRGQVFELAGVTLDWEQLAAARWTVNGERLGPTFGMLLDAVPRLLDPAVLGPAAVVAHGDAHNANVWRGDHGLTWFDPAFAGRHVPALLAEVKATFHNVWAHPFWLYQPALAATRFSVRAAYTDGELSVDTDWAPSSMRAAFAATKGELVWRPLLAAMAEQGLLVAGWRDVVRTALFACPALVMNLRPGPASVRDHLTGTLGLAVAMLVGSGAAGVDELLDAAEPD